MLRSRILSLMLHVDSYCKSSDFAFRSLICFSCFEGVFGVNCDMGTIKFYSGGDLSMWVS